jgi:hypothetical protein
MASGIVALDKINQFFLILPEDTFRKIDLLQDREEELKTIIYV